MGATFSSEISVDLKLAIRRYIPEDRTIHNQRCEDSNQAVGFCGCGNELFDF
jgi:hypothetical protein